MIRNHHVDVAYGREVGGFPIRLPMVQTMARYRVTPVRGSAPTTEISGAWLTANGLAVPAMAAEQTQIFVLDKV